MDRELVVVVVVLKVSMFFVVAVVSLWTASFSADFDGLGFLVLNDLLDGIHGVADENLDGEFVILKAILCYNLG